MNRKIVWLAFVSVLLLSIAYGTIWSGGFVTTASPRIWTVGLEGWPKYDFAKIQDAIDNYQVRDGDTVLVAAGTYKENVTIHKSLNLIGINGSDVTIIDAGDISTNAIVDIMSSDVRIENFTIQYAQALFPSGIRVRTDLKPISGIVIHKSKVKGVNQGIDSGSMIYSKYPLNDAEFTENTISASFAGIVIIPRNITCANFFISKNTFAAGLEAIGLYSNVTKSVICENNISLVKSGINVLGYFNSITNNTFTSIKEIGIYVEGDSNNVDHNTITNIEGNGIYVRGDSNNVDHNTITNIESDGIFLIGNSSNIYNNKITDIENGILVSGSLNNIINNTIQNGTGGILCVQVMYDGVIYNVQTYISDNEIRDCTFGVWANSNASTVNNFLRNCTYGLVVGGNFSTVTLNTLMSCLYGAYVLNETNGNAIYHNMFLNSSAADDSKARANSWDAGNRTGGNYWCDYEREDLNRDGFGDTPRNIYNIYHNETNNKDNYPLIVPCGPIPVFWKDTKYDCLITGNMTVCRFGLEENKTISFKTIGHGYVNLTISRELLDGSFKVDVNGTPTLWLSSWTETHTSIYFECETSGSHIVGIEAQVKAKPWKLGDINEDGTVNIKDIYIVARNFGKTIEG